MARTQTQAVSKPNHFNQQKMIDLWNKGKSVTEIAKQLDASPVWTRRVLATKAPQDYKRGLEARHAETPRNRASIVTASVAGGSKAQTVDSVLVETIARAVASAAFSNAQLVPQPTTRTEMFENISNGVREGIKKSGMGFHSNS